MKSFAALFFASCFALSQLALAQDSDVSISTPGGVVKGALRVANKANGMVALIISGSGPTDRNGNNIQMTNNSLRMLADSLAEHGISSLRYDKRGVAASMSALKNEGDIRFDYYVDDAVSWIALLKKDHRFNKIAVLGHSEGSLIGMIAAQRGKADYFVSIAGVGEQAHVTLKRQIKQNSPSISQTCNLLLDSLAAGHTVSSYSQDLAILFRASVQPYLISWFKVNPVQEIAKLNIPILILQGTSDSQVEVNDAKALAAANPKSTLVIIPGMNHVLKTITLPIENEASYNDPKLPLAADLVKNVVGFLK